VVGGRDAVGCGANCLYLQGHSASCHIGIRQEMGPAAKPDSEQTKSGLSPTPLFRHIPGALTGEDLRQNGFVCFVLMYSYPSGFSRL
jgi:hypothetical protein